MLITDVDDVPLDERSLDALPAQIEAARALPEFVARLGKAFGAPRPGGEFVVLPDMKALLVSLTPEACSG